MFTTVLKASSNHKRHSVETKQFTALVSTRESRLVARDNVLVSQTLHVYHSFHPSIVRPSRDEQFILPQGQ